MTLRRPVLGVRGKINCNIPQGYDGSQRLEITLVEVPAGTVRAKGSLWSLQTDE